MLETQLLCLALYDKKPVRNRHQSEASNMMVGGLLPGLASFMAMLPLNSS